MKLEIAAEVLRAAAVGVVGETLFVNDMPFEVTEGVLLRDNYAGTAVHPYLPGYRNTGFTVAVRSPDYQAGRALAYRAFNALSPRLEQLVLGAQVKRMAAVTEPRPYRRTAGGFWEFEIEVEIAYVLPPA